MTARPIGWILGVSLFGLSLQRSLLLAPHPGPPPDPVAERLAELEAQQIADAEAAAAAAERLRSACYQEQQRAAVEKRESGKW